MRVGVSFVAGVGEREVSERERGREREREREGRRIDDGKLKVGEALWTDARLQFLCPAWTTSTPHFHL